MRMGGLDESRSLQADAAVSVQRVLDRAARRVLDERRTGVPSSATSDAPLTLFEVSAG
jgi:hypothetical protein